MELANEVTLGTSQTLSISRMYGDASLLGNYFSVIVTDKRCEGLTDLKEQWYDTDYKIDDLSPSSLDKWKQTENHPEIHLPKKNSFIPQKFDLCPLPDDPPEFPEVVKVVENTETIFHHSSQL